jgi:hypothetical protein
LIGNGQQLIGDRINLPVHSPFEGGKEDVINLMSSTLSLFPKLTIVKRFLKTDLSFLFFLLLILLKNQTKKNEK